MKKILCLLLIAQSPGLLRAADDHIVMIKTEDAEMNAAIDAARNTLPSFWKVYEKPSKDESDFYIKLAIPEDGKTEHFWISDLKKEKDHWVGIVANEPELIHGVKLGQRIVIEESRISDWKYLKAGHTKGGFTIAVLLKRLPKAEADEFRKQLGWD